MGLVLLLLGVIVAQNGTSQLKGGPGSDAVGAKSKAEGAGLDKMERSEGTRSQAQSRADGEASVSGSESSQRSKSTSSRSGSALTIRSRTSGGTPITKKKSFPWQPIVFTLLMVIMAALVARGTWAGLAYVDRKKMQNAPVANTADETTDATPPNNKSPAESGKAAQSKLRAPEKPEQKPLDSADMKKSDSADVQQGEKGNWMTEWLKERVLPVRFGGYPVGKGGKAIPLPVKIAGGVATAGAVGIMGMKATGVNVGGYGAQPSINGSFNASDIPNNGSQQQQEVPKGQQQEVPKGQQQEVPKDVPNPAFKQGAGESPTV